MILADPDTGSTELDFGQPIYASRLVPFYVANLEEPIEGQELSLDILRCRGDGKWMRARVATQSSTGAVRLVYDDGREETVDLAMEEYRWVG